MTDAGRIRIHLTGPFKIESSTGVDITPAGEKARGLVAMLALSRYGNRSRYWLKNMLWSDYSPELASARLRQTLFKIRKTLGSDQDALFSDRKEIGLARYRVELVGDHSRELLEGIDVGDNEFEYWLLMNRSIFFDRVNSSKRSD